MAPMVIDLTEAASPAPSPPIWPRIIDLTVNTSDGSVASDEQDLPTRQQPEQPLAKTEPVNQPTPSASTVTPTSAARDRSHKGDQGQSASPTQHRTPPPRPSSRRHENASPTMSRNAAGSRLDKRTPSALGSSHNTPKQNTPRQQQTPRGPKLGDWTKDRIAEELLKFIRTLDHGHRIMCYRIFQANKRVAKQQAPAEGPDLFASMSLDPVPEERGVTVKAKFKQHSTSTRKANANAGKKQQMHFKVTPISTNVEAVPSYRFHHIEISKSVLTPPTRLKYAPHVRDLDESEEVLYNKWLQELTTMEEQSGFKPESRERRVATTTHNEAAARLAAILPAWLYRLKIDGVTKSTLIRYMATQERDDTITPQQKSSILDSQGEEAGSPHAMRAAKMFTEAYDSVFNRPDLRARAVSLRDVLFRDEAVDTIVDSKRLTTGKEAAANQNQDDEFNINAYLETHSLLGCLICFSNSCDHGDFDAKNQKCTFNLDLVGGIEGALERRAQRSTQHRATEEQRRSYETCGDQCFKHPSEMVAQVATKPWDAREIRMLKALIITAQTGPDFRPPECNAAGCLQRPCWEVRRKCVELGIEPYKPRSFNAETLPRQPDRNLTFYDRHKKALMNDWQDRHVIYEHQKRELNDPCNHDGPCTIAAGCPCAEFGVLCERFCRCTAEACARKFTGCTCHALGKNCYTKQKERPCICVQLNRECDPSLCGGCGAYDRCNPENRDDDELHKTGCQNCALQRGKAKVVVLGQSQLDGCGYGLWTAEDIAQDEFVIEYVGELISHDEGVRREARRGDAFNQEANPSYVFTLLETEGIWVDAAVYGNLSRYINHAVDSDKSDKKGCNVVPKILYVNGEFRIRFSALRDIKTGEELFFNYGENFPNLTKKLLEDKDNKKGEQDDGAESGVETSARRKRKSGRAGARMLNRRKDARSKREAATRRSKASHNNWTADPAPVMAARSRKRKRAVEEDEEGDEQEEEEYRPEEVPDSEEPSASTEESEHMPAQRTLARRTKRTRRFSPSWEDEVGPVEVDSISINVEETPTRPARRGPGRPRGSGTRRHRSIRGRNRTFSEVSEASVKRDTSEDEEEDEDQEDREEDDDDEEAEAEAETPVRRRRGRPKRMVVDDDDDKTLSADQDDDEFGPGGSRNRLLRATQRPARFRDNL